MPVIERPPNERAPKDGSKDDRAVKLWEHRIRAAERKLKKKGGKVSLKGSDWEKYIKFFEGSQWPEDQQGYRQYHRVTSNEAKSSIDAIRPQLYFQNPKVRISLKNPSLAPQDIYEIDPATGQPMMQQGPPDPMTGMPTQVPVVKIPRGTPVAVIGGQQVNGQEQVDLLEAIDNYYLEEMDAKNVMRRVINDALVLPYGVAKLEWVVDVEEVEQPDPNIPGKSMKVEQIVSRGPRLKRVPPWRFIWDCDLEEFNVEYSAHWVAEIEFYSKEELEADKLLTVDFDDLQERPDRFDDETYDDSGDEDETEKRRRYKTYLIHDLKAKRYMVWVEGSKFFNRVDDPSTYSYVEGGIYTLLGFDETPGDSFPLPKLKQIMSEAQAYNYIISAQTNHVFRFNRKYQAMQNDLSPEEMEKLTKGADGTVVISKSGNPILPIADAPLSVDMYNVASQIKKLMNEKMGVSAYSKTAREPGVDTAFEANLIQGGSDTKIQEMRDVVREFAKRMVRKLNQLIKSYADAPTVTEIVGINGTKWVQWNNKDIAGEFVEDVDIYTGAIYSKEVERKQWMEVLSIANGNPYVNQPRLWERVFRAFDEGSELLNTPQEMAEMQAAQAQQQQQQQQVEESKRQASQTMRPSEGETRRGTDMQAGIKGQAANWQPAKVQ